MANNNNATTFLDLTPQCLSQVFGYLCGKDAAVVCCTSRVCRDVIHADDSLWRSFLASDFGQDNKQGPNGQAAGTFREAYCAWRESFGPEYDPYVKRAVQAWARIKAWLATHYPEVLASLQPGATEEEVAAVERELHVQLPPAVKAIYRIHNGQELIFDRRMDEASPARPESDAEVAAIFHGMFGGYAVYDHIVCTRLLPLRRMARRTQHLGVQRQLPQSVLVACSFRVQDKMVLLDTASGELKVSRRLVSLERAAPLQDTQPGARDSMLRWFEEYSRRLSADMYEVALLDEEFAQSRSICLFPLQPPIMRQEITRGVRVRASVLYIPEQSPPNKHLFAYSIRFALLPTEQQPAHWPATAGPFHALLKCQLMSRHWVIRDGEGKQVDEVRGDAVIGKYPILEPGAPEFVYQSCTHQTAERGAMEGEFRFVEGTIDRRAGGEWDVICPRFMLEVPQYIF